MSCQISNASSSPLGIARNSVLNIMETFQDIVFVTWKVPNLHDTLVIIWQLLTISKICKITPTMCYSFSVSLTFSSCSTPPRVCTFIVVICRTHFTCCLIQHTVLTSLAFAFALFVPAVSVLLYHFIFPACKLMFWRSTVKGPATVSVCLVHPVPVLTIFLI